MSKVLYRTVQEIQTMADDRAVFMQKGYTWEQATLRAYDIMFAVRRHKENQDV